MTTLNIASDETGINPVTQIENQNDSLSWRNYLQTIILAIITITVAIVGSAWYMQGQSTEATTTAQAYTPLPVYKSTVDLEPTVVQSVTSNAPTENASLSDNRALSSAEDSIPAAPAVSIDASEASALATANSSTPDVVEPAVAVPVARSSTAAASVPKSEYLTNLSLPSVVRAGGAPLMSSPDGETIMTLSTGDALVATERTADNGWLYVQVKKGIDGWISAEQTLTLNVKQLPVAMSNLNASIDAQLDISDNSLTSNGTSGISQLMTTLSSLELPEIGDVTSGDVANN